MSTQQDIQIGSGAMFPIQLEQSKNDQGLVELVLNEDGVLVPKVGWYTKTGDIELIKQNITAILTFQIGQRFRQESFGSRTWDLLEEPNTSALELIIAEYIRNGLGNWEPRIYNIQVESIRQYTSIYLHISFSVKGTNLSSDSYYQYNI